jgi:hypothetical protein
VNPNKDADFRWLKRAVEASYKALAPFRDMRYTIVRQFTGSHYGDNANMQKVPIPLINLTMRIVMRYLISQNPSVLGSTFQTEYKPSTYKLQLALNKKLPHLGFAKTMERVALDALLCMGFAKTGLEEVGVLAFEDEEIKRGEPFIERISLDNVVFDMGAVDDSRWAYVGDVYRVPLERLKEAKLFDPDKLRASDLPGSGIVGQGERLDTLSRDNVVYREGEYEDHINLWDIYLPQEHLLVTYPAETYDGPPHVVDWYGPERGPYRKLGFGPVPDQTVDCAPSLMWYDLHRLVNTLYNKLMDQAERQKIVGGYRAESALDVERIIETADGETIEMSDPNGLVEHPFGGIDQRNFAFMLDALNRYSWLAGNLDALGGLGPQSETLGQDELLTKAASKFVEELQDRVTDFTTEAVRDIGWYVWHDPLLDEPLTGQVQNTNMEVPMRFTSEDRMGAYEDREIQLVPTSMRALTPAARVQTILGIVERVVLPSMPFIVQDGGKFFIDRLLKYVSEYTNLPEIAEIIEFGPTRADVTQQPGQMQAPGKPAVTSREYVRKNIPGGSRQGRDAAMMQTLMGAGVQDANAAAMMKMGATG